MSTLRLQGVLDQTIQFVMGSKAITGEDLPCRDLTYAI